MLRREPPSAASHFPPRHPRSLFKADVIIKCKKEALEDALDQGRIALAICWKDKMADQWKEKSRFWGKNKDIINAELRVILEALDMAPITIFCDSQKALKAIALPLTCQENWVLEVVYTRRPENFNVTDIPSLSSGFKSSKSFGSHRK